MLRTYGNSVFNGGNVGIGTSSPAVDLHVKGAGATNLRLEQGNGSNYGQIKQNQSLQALQLGVGGDFAMTINSAENVGIGTTSPNTKLHIEGGFVVRSSSSSVFNDSNNAENVRMLDAGITFNDDAVDKDFTIKSDNNAAMFHVDAGNDRVGIGTATPTQTLTVSGTLTSGAITASGESHIAYSGSYTDPDQGTARDVKFGDRGIAAASGYFGSISKGSGSFKIDHPLESKKDTHDLVHSFVEAPQADLIYRGTATLSSGSATVNLDTVAGMTEGTYVLLNTNSSCFTSNETDWDSVKGSISGNILTISCQNTSSTATVSWLVIGERHDQHMKDTDWTDSDGKVIIEPLK